MRCIFRVSIPVGFFQALQHILYSLWTARAGLFQSLSGFFRPCNDAVVNIQIDEDPVSIPVGFFQALQRRHHDGEQPPEIVSIPVGLLQALQLADKRAAYATTSFSFNPCRVFSGLATLARSFRRPAPSLFQSLSGFFRPCNAATHRRSVRRGYLFQSLSGFFRPCNDKIREDSGYHAVFQSLSGFFRPCNKSYIDTIRTANIVSIPVGFFQALQRPRRTSKSSPSLLFQSLSGFFRPCNAMMAAPTRLS